MPPCILQDNAREARVTDMLLNYEAVKLFCAEELEVSHWPRAHSSGPSLSLS